MMKTLTAYSDRVIVLAAKPLVFDLNEIRTDGQWGHVQYITTRKEAGGPCAEEIGTKQHISGE